MKLIAVFEVPDELTKYGYDEMVTKYPVPAGFADMLIGKTAESYIRTMYRVPIQPNTQSDMPNARPQTN